MVNTLYFLKLVSFNYDLRLCLCERSLEVNHDKVLCNFSTSKQWTRAHFFAQAFMRMRSWRHWNASLRYFWLQLGSCSALQNKKLQSRNGKFPFTKKNIFKRNWPTWSGSILTGVVLMPTSSSWTLLPLSLDMWNWVSASVALVLLTWIWIFY